ncbi:copper chaperone PCu(A)C [Oceanimonas sp. CHS3-5]|uniref:copper chaperone PCu(A)C n=1 Tax=Oceanimonas sp. CHS3-5 TaxID=3068186 RepID=UPI00273E8822|nr:copper chaperone PCu(A)C [Oceanimonas sp. CHS3-5]MDP5293601.1 copper chaperone PCu(A)C [Oceanimonas sp. CHS3-5]
MNKMRSAIASLLLLSATGAVAHEYEQGSLQIAHPWSRPAPPMAANGSAYLVINNHGHVDDVLLSAESPVAERVEIHTHMMDGDMMKMRQLEQLPVPAGEAVTLAPGGHHLMLFGLKQAPREGERFPLTLHFEQAGEVAVEVSVDADHARPEEKASDDGHHH